MSLSTLIAGPEMSSVGCADAKIDRPRIIAKRSVTFFIVGEL
jgi:hypothetical protein